MKKYIENFIRSISRGFWNSTVHHIILEAMKRNIIKTDQAHEILGAWNALCFPERGHASFLVKEIVQPIRMLINPRSLKVGYKKIKNPLLPGGKIYVAVIGRPSRRGKRYFSSKTAEAANTYAKEVFARWIRLYDKAIELQVAEKVTEEVAIDSKYAVVIENADAPAEEAKG